MNVHPSPDKEIIKCKQDFSPIPASQELFGEADAELYLKYWCGLFDALKIAKKPKGINIIRNLQKKGTHRHVFRKQGWINHQGRKSRKRN